MSIGRKLIDFLTGKWLWRKITGSFAGTIVNKSKTGLDSAVNKLYYKKSEELMTPLLPGEKIRLMFLFQMASLFPSWESLYESCMADDRFEVTFALLTDENNVSMTQMLTAETFLQSKKIPYEVYSDTLMVCTRPHVVVIQTPYDWYREQHTKSAVLQRYGARVVYIPYGIEIADTSHARKDHFKTGVLNCWRVYTFSPQMCADYASFCSNGVAARCCGHPKFDSYLHKERFPLPETVQNRIHERRIILWHIHFPKLVKQEDNTYCLATPYLSEYIRFADFIREAKDCFFIVQPHPRFLDCEEALQPEAQELYSKLQILENVYFDLDDDYRTCLINADYIITDRSAIMVEGAACAVPILYMYNADYSEALTAAITPLINSYAQGTNSTDMIRFVERCMQGIDPEKEAREVAFRQCIPFHDGRNGERIKEDIAQSLFLTDKYQLSKLQEQVFELTKAVQRLENALRERME